jgi:Cu2+-exporting ATPase
VAQAVERFTARSITRFVSTELTDSLPLASVEEVAGKGMSARFAGSASLWRLGSALFTQASDESQAQGESHAQGATQQCFVSRDGVPIMRFDLHEALRDDATKAVQGLQQRGLKVALLSGDQPAQVRRVATQLGVADAEPACTPEGKLAYVQQLHAQGYRVAMVGDGVNDAPVLAQADVSVAMQEAADSAKAQADFIVLGGRLQHLVTAHSLARSTRRVVKQNLVWAAGYNLLCIPLAMAGWLPPWLASLGMAASSLLVVGNALRLTRVPGEGGA